MQEPLAVHRVEYDLVLAISCLLFALSLRVSLKISVPLLGEIVIHYSSGIDLIGIFIYSHEFEIERIIHNHVVNI